MQLELTEEQQMLADSVARFVEHDYGFDQRNKYLAADKPLNQNVWQQFAELGWLGAGLPESMGGSDGGAVEQAVIAEQLGRAMALEPFVSTAVVGAHALTLADNAELSEALLTRLIAGELLLALAYAEPGGRYDMHHVATSATSTGNRFSLSGNKSAVMDASSAHQLIVSARVNGATRAGSGIGLFLVDTDAQGVSTRHFHTADGTNAADVRLDNAPAQLLVSQEHGLVVLEQLIERAISARCAQAAGAMHQAYEQTLEYLKTREQFGVPIGSFQVLQHRMVDMLMAVRECQSMTLMTAGKIMSEDAVERRCAAAAAKAYVGKRARNVAQEIVQLHGGVGMTEELSIGHFFRYLIQFCSLYGSTAYHLQRYTALP
jgi:alkylation response protein AidB-like acyl-CoA dehydrogenase